VILHTADAAKEANPGKGASFNPINTLESTAREDYRNTLAIAN
jgi:hypothetical protein